MTNTTKLLDLQNLDFHNKIFALSFYYIFEGLCSLFSFSTVYGFLLKIFEGACVMFVIAYLGLNGVYLRSIEFWVLS